MTASIAAAWSGRLAVRERRLEPVQPVLREVVRDSRRVLAARVELEELAGELANRGARAALELVPRLASELGQGRRLRVGADVARDLADLLVRDVEAVFAAERELEVVARDAGDLARLEAEQLADAVVLVDDVVSGAELGEGLERAAGGCGAAAGAAAEDLRVGEQREPELAPDEAAARVGDGEQELRLVGQLLALVDQTGVDAAQQVLRAQRFALVRERDDGAQAAADERAELVLGFGEAARGDRGALRLERERLAGRERVELDRVRQVDRRQLLLLPDLADVDRLPDEVRARRDRRHEVGRDRSRSLAGLVVGKSDVVEVEPALGRGVDRDLVDRMQRALRERREGADALDLVAEELDAERLAPGRRIDVDDASAERELASLLRLVDALVARERELLGERVDPRLVARSNANRLRARLGRGHAPRRARLPRR